MSPFEFFFSLYGLLLGLSVAVLATGGDRRLKSQPGPVWTSPFPALSGASEDRA